MKQSIEWHEVCYLASVASLNRLGDAIVAEEKRYNTMRENLMQYAWQISIAKQRGLKAFDRDRLLKKQTKKETK